METLAAASTYCHTTIQITTNRPAEFVDLTDRLVALVAESGIRFGFVNVQTLHTTTAIVVNEHEPLLLTDFARLLENAAPRDAIYRHDDLTVRVNGHAHCQALLLAPSAGLNVVDGRLQLGDWQRVFLAELDGPRERQISIMVLGEGRR